MPLQVYYFILVSSQRAIARFIQGQRIQTKLLRKCLQLQTQDVRRMRVHNYTIYMHGTVNSTPLTRIGNLKANRNYRIA